MKSLLSILITVILLLSGCSGGVSEESRFQDASASYSNKEYSKAVIELKNLLQANSDHKAARILLAKSYLALGDGSSAEKEINSINVSQEVSVEAKQIIITAWELQAKHQNIVEKYEEGYFSALDKKTQNSKVANSYIHVRQPEKADELAQELLQIEQNNVDALVVRAKAASMRNNDEQAIEYLNKAIALDAENHQVWRALGGIQSKLQEFDQAIESLKRAIALAQPEDSKQEQFLTKVSLIQLLVQKAQFDESKLYLEELKRGYKSNPIVGYLSGLHNYIDKKYDAAKTELTEVHTALPSHLPTVLLLGATHFSENNLEQANVLLSRYVNQVPTHLQARKLLGEIKLRLNKPKEALKILKSSGEQQRDYELLSMIGSAASQSGDYLQGVEYLKEAVRSHPENTRIREELAKLYLSQGAVDDAIAELEQLESSQQGNSSNLLILSYLKKQDIESARKQSDQVFAGGRALTASDFYLRAVIELLSGNRREARSNLNKAEESDAAYTPALVALGRMDLEDGRLSEGSEHLNLVLATDPYNTHAMLLLAQISERSGQQNEALKWLDRAAQSSRNSTLPRIIIARYYLRTKQAEKAAKYLDDPALRQSENPAILSLIAEMDQQMGNHEQAESLIERMITINPDNRDAYLQLADLQSKRGDYKSAQSTLDKARPLSQKGQLLQFKIALGDKRFDKAESVAKALSNKPETKYTGIILLSGVAQARGRPQTAISQLKKHLSPEAPFVLYRKLADLYAMNGDINSATALLTRRIETKPGGDNQAKLALAMIYQSNGKVENAVKLYDELLSVEPENIVALNNAALLIFDSKPERALNLARRAFERVGDSSLAVTDTYAWLKHQTGDTKAALNLIRPILNRTSDPSILYHYAVMLAEVGQKGEAREILESVFENNQQFQESNEAKQLLSELSSANG
ncbi:MAG: XrtA/PEP-CTERM system TPR-repeat protein PrsT [Candidatus Thiodiazotropha sp. 6PLUC4]